MVETERRFLMKYLPVEINDIQPTEIEDCMIITGEPHSHLRLRRKNDKYELTRKYPKQEGELLEMVEENIFLSEIEFNTLKKLPNTGQRKFRYKFEIGSVLAEVDIWKDNLEGLAIVEFEFSSAEEARDFNPPDFCLLEVTDMEWLAGGKLSGKSYQDIVHNLQKIGYKKL